MHGTPMKNTFVAFGEHKIALLFSYNVSHPVVFLKFIQNTNSSLTQQFYYYNYI